MTDGRKNNGGKRKGAGRKPEGKKLIISAMVAPMTKRWLAAIANEADCTMGEALDMACVMARFRVKK